MHCNDCLLMFDNQIEYMQHRQEVCSKAWIESVVSCILWCLFHIKLFAPGKCRCSSQRGLLELIEIWLLCVKKAELRFQWCWTRLDNIMQGVNFLFVLYFPICLSILLFFLFVSNFLLFFLFFSHFANFLQIFLRNLNILSLSFLGPSLIFLYFCFSLASLGISFLNWCKLKVEVLVLSWHRYT